MNDLWAVVPVKPLRAAKSRLAPALSPERRLRLAENLLAHTLEVLAGWDALAGTLVVSADGQVRERCARLGVATLTETGLPGLNISLSCATARAVELGARAVLVVPADLPFLDRDSLRQVIAAAEGGASVVIAPDQTRAGTNALLTAPPGCIPYLFGPDSFRRHLSAAAEKDLPVREVCLPNLALDIDLPEDLESIRAAGLY